VIRLVLHNNLIPFGSPASTASRPTTVALTTWARVHSVQIPDSDIFARLELLNSVQTQDPMVEDIEEAVRDFPGFPSPVIGMATTPSDLPEDARMEDPPVLMQTWTWPHLLLSMTPLPLPLILLPSSMTPLPLPLILLPSTSSL